MPYLTKMPSLSLQNALFAARKPCAHWVCFERGRLEGAKIERYSLPAFCLQLLRPNTTLVVLTAQHLRCFACWVVVLGHVACVPHVPAPQKHLRAAGGSEESAKEKLPK